MASTQHSLRPESRLGAVYCTRVGIYWPGVVRTARAPDPHGVHPTLVQWRPTLVQYVPNSAGFTAWSWGSAAVVTGRGPRVETRSPGAPGRPQQPPATRTHDMDNRRCCGRVPRRRAHRAAPADSRRHIMTLSAPTTPITPAEAAAAADAALRGCDSGISFTMRRRSLLMAGFGLGAAGLLAAPPARRSPPGPPEGVAARPPGPPRPRPPGPPPPPSTTRPAPPTRRCPPAPGAAPSETSR